MVLADINDAKETRNPVESRSTTDSKQTNMAVEPVKVELPLKAEPSTVSFQPLPPTTMSLSPISTPLIEEDLGQPLFAVSKPIHSIVETQKQSVVHTQTIATPAISNSFTSITFTLLLSIMWYICTVSL